MEESFIQHLFAERIGGAGFGRGTAVYKFEKIKRAKREAGAKHPGTPIIDFGIGESDDVAHQLIRDTMKREVDEFENRTYADNGIAEFKEAAARYMQTMFGVNVDPATEVVHCIGTKPALAMLPLTLVNPGDVVFMTVPGYPVFGTHAKYLGGEVVNLPLRKEHNFYPQLDSIPEDKLRRGKVLVLNYPNNPTGKVADERFYREVVDFARTNNIVVVVDAAYAAIVFNRRPLSFMSIDGAKEVGIELISLSKAFDMTGWRLGFVCGNSLLVSAYAAVKDNTDSGQFRAIQKAGVTALDNCHITDGLCRKYLRRLERLASILRACGFDVPEPEGTFYLYVEAPRAAGDGTQFETAEDFTQYLIREKLVSAVPWDDAGRFVRFSVTFGMRTLQEEDELFAEFERRMNTVELVF